MPKVLTQEQIDFYLENGYLSPIDVMSEDEAIVFRNRFEEAERQYPEHVHSKNRNNTHLAFKCMDELAHHPRILDVVEDLIGPNLSLWGTVLFIKEPSSSSFVSWHQDATYMGLNNNNVVTPWVALSPSTRETGCMTMIPGTHRNSIVVHVDTFEENNILTRGQRVRDVDTSKGVDLILRPGQMSLHHGEIIHGSQPNNSNERRIGFALQSYAAPEVRQIVGDNLWMDVRGDNPREDSEQLQRPQFDLDPAADRARANKNLADILYNGAKQRREY